MPAIYLLFLSIFFGFILTSSTTSADELVDEINVNVPISCSLAGTGMDSHTTSLMNGNYASDVGTTTLKALCNDNEGFAIYAIGYTDDTDGKTVMTNSALDSDYDIQTGTGTSGNSQWAMRLSTQTSPEPTYPISIMNNYNQYHVIPDDYELVAKRTAATDVGTAAIGSTLTSTYQIYVSTTQPAGTYTGKVKYTLIHPNYADSDALKNAVTVVFDGNGLTFPDGTTTNTVKYANICRPGDPGYVGSTYQEVMTSNINPGGQSSGSYDSDESILQPVTISGADRLKVVIRYGFSNAMGAIIEGNWDGESEPDSYQILDENDNNEKTFVFDGDTITALFNSQNSAEEDFNYGIYVKVYPIYNTEQPGATYEEFPSDDCFITSISSAYTETTEWHGKWTAEIPYEYESCYWDDELQEDVCETIAGTDEREFKDKAAGCDQWGYCWDAESAEIALLRYIQENYGQLKRSTINLSSYVPVTFDQIYASANKSKVNGYYKIQDLNVSMCSEVSIDETTTVIDIRDNNIYSIGKFSDGNCWLRDNLRLNPLDSSTASNMSSSNTNASDNAIYNYYHGGNPSGVDGWTSTIVSSPNDWEPTNNLLDPFIHISENNSYGIYYNYCAATVGTYCYTNGNYNSSSFDVCPINWNLPSLYQFTDVDAQSITSTLGGSYSPGITSNPTDYMVDEGSRGYYWTSSYANSFMMKSAECRFGGGNCRDSSYGSNGTPRYTGLPIRCVVSVSD